MNFRVLLCSFTSSCWLHNNSLNITFISLFVLIVTEEGQVTFGALVGEMSILPAFEAGDLV